MVTEAYSLVQFPYSAPCMEYYHEFFKAIHVGRYSIQGSYKIVTVSFFSVDLIGDTQKANGIGSQIGCLMRTCIIGLVSDHSLPYESYASMSNATTVI